MTSGLSEIATNGTALQSPRPLKKKNPAKRSTLVLNPGLMQMNALPVKPAWTDARQKP
jgi:hypothetical protein